MEPKHNYDVRGRKEPVPPKGECMKVLFGCMGKLEYVRRGPWSEGLVIRRSKKKGILLAFPSEEGEMILVGWSLCHWDLDDFDADYGVGIAFDRALAWREKEVKLADLWAEESTAVPSIERLKMAAKVPHSIREELVDFIVKMRHYYTDKQFPQWVDCLE